MQSQSAANWLIKFCHSYDQSRRKHKKESRRTSRTFDPTNLWQMRAMDEHRIKRDRIENGYVNAFPREIAGRVRGVFREHGLRSVDNPILKLFVSRLPRGGRLRAAENKAELSVPFWSKLLTLDCPYIEGSRRSLSFIRLDCDAVFRSADACVAALSDKVRDGAIPHLPHILVGDTLDDGTFANPHFIFMLRDSVWRDEDDTRCRQGPIRLYEAVYRGLASALLDIGVDPSAPGMTARCKNPISPVWTTITYNSEHFLSLEHYAGVLDITTSRQELVRRSAEIQSGLEKGPSNELFNALTDHCAKTLKAWYMASDDRLSSDKETLGAILYQELSRVVADSGFVTTAGNPKKMKRLASYVCAKVAGYMASTFDGSRLNAKTRGRLAHVIQPHASRSDRQRLGAQYAQQARAQKTREKLKAVVFELMTAGKFEGMSKELIASAAGVSRSAVYAHLGAVVEEIGRGCETPKTNSVSGVSQDQCSDQAMFAVAVPARIESLEPPRVVGDFEHWYEQDDEEIYERDSHLYRRVESCDEDEHYE